MIMKKSVNSWKNAKSSSASNNDGIKLRTKNYSKKQNIESKLTENDPNGFGSFVQEKLKQEGFELSQEEEKLIQEAIKKALKE